MKLFRSRRLLAISALLVAFLISTNQADAAFIRRNVTPPTVFNNGLVVFNGSNMFGQTNFFGPVNLDGNVLDFGRGSSKIEDNGDLTLTTDNYLFLNAKSRVAVQNDLQVKGQLQITQGDKDNGSVIYDNGDLVIFSNDAIKLESKKDINVQSNTIFHGDLKINGDLQLPSQSIDTADLADGAVTNPKLATDAVTSGKILDGTIVTADMADSAVTNVKLAGDSVTSDKILNGTIVNEDISSGAAIDLSKLASGPTANIIVANGSGVPTYVGMSGDATIATDGTLTISADAVTTGKILNGTILTEDLADGLITTAKLADSSVTNVKLAADAVTSDKILNGTITSDDIMDATLATADIMDGAVTNVKLAGDAVTSDKISDGSVGTADLADDAVTTPKIFGGAVSTAKLADLAITTGKLGDTAVTNPKIADTTIGLGKLTTGASGQIIVLNALGVPVYVGVTGDISIAADGTVTLSADAVGSSNIADGTIINADIAAGAGIAYSKLAIADGDLTIAKTSGLQTALDGKLNLTGGTLSGDLLMGGNNISGAGTVTATTFVGDLTGSQSGGSVSASTLSATGAVDFETAPSLQLPVVGVTPPCGAGEQGHIVFSDVDKHFYGCNGTTWKQLDN